MPRLNAEGRHVVAFTLNGRPVKGVAAPRTLLSDFLRHELGATGTHVGCEHGVCGACSVTVDGKIVRSCLMFAVQANGSAITTIEGIAGAELHPVQQAFWDHHALQCGFCTPGMLLTVMDLVERKTDLTETDVRASLSGNMCRCTGYQFIVDATLAVARQAAKKDSQ
jgi:aerobic-type carbon monoxide dehydrogenase small subunit (CoxS/CutS family)